MRKGTLTERQRRFVEEYLNCGCAAKAAEAAGYEYTYASNVMSQPAVKAYLAQRRKELAREIPLTADVIRALIRIAKAEKDENGKIPDGAQIKAARIVANAMNLKAPRTEEEE